MEIWKTSGHAANYKENMFIFEVSTWYEHRVVHCPVASAPPGPGIRRNGVIDIWVFLLALVIRPSPFINRGVSKPDPSNQETISIRGNFFK